jgi:hypothetical protein
MGTADDGIVHVLHLIAVCVSAHAHVVADRNEKGNTKMTVKGYYITQVVNIKHFSQAIRSGTQKN